MLMFSQSTVNTFVHKDKNLRWGQAFYDFMKLHKITNPEDKIFCDRLYNAEDGEAKHMVMARLDFRN